MKLTPHQIYRLQNNFRRLSILLAIVGFGFLLRLKGCQSDEDKGLQKSMVITEGTGQELQGATLTAYDDTTKIWVLKTEKLIQDPTIKQIRVAPVNLTMFNDSGIVTTTVISDSGLTTEKMNSFYIWGRVIITDREGSTIRSRSLSWDQKKRELESSDFVEIAAKTGEVMRGKGFNAAEDFSWWEFHKDVSGEFHNFDEKLGFQEDK